MVFVKFAAKFRLTWEDVREISGYAGKAFIRTFDYIDSSDEKENSDSSDTGVCELESDNPVCPDVSPATEELVKQNWQICDPLEDIFGEKLSSTVKETVTSPNNEAECDSLKLIGFFASPDENGQEKDTEVLAFCSTLASLCCCETLKRASPIIAQATANLFYK